MLDERIPCLEIVSLLPTGHVTDVFIQFLATTTGLNKEVLLNSFVGSGLSNANSTDNFCASDVTPLLDQTTNCSAIIKSIDSDYFNICYLCKRSSKYTNLTKGIEQALLSYLISPKATASFYKRTEELKPTHFKTRFLIIMGKAFVVFPLFRYFYQFIHGPAPMSIQNNLLLDNSNIPNWVRIIEAFLLSRIFKRAVKYDSLLESQQNALLIFCREVLLSLAPTDVDSKQAEEWIHILSRTQYRSKKTKAALPPQEDAELFLLPPSLPPIQEEIPTIPELPCNEFTMAENDLGNVSKPTFRFEQEFITVGPADVTIFSDEIVRIIVHDAFIQKCVVIEAALYNGIRGIILYVLNTFCVFGTAKELRYILKEIITDITIEKYTSTYVEIARLCAALEISSFNNLNSLFAAGFAATGDSGNMIHGGANGTTCLKELMNTYPDTYNNWLLKADPHKVRSLHSFEFALSTVHEPFKRNSFFDCTFSVGHTHCGCNGTQLTMRYSPRENKGVQLFASDRELLIEILSSLFTVTEIQAFCPALLYFKESEISIFFNTKERKKLCWIEEMIVQSIMRAFKKFQYEIPQLYIKY